MKKLLMLMIASVICIQSVHADDDAGARIKIAINGALKSDNSYFLCMESTGCLSILSAHKGRIFNMSSAVGVNGIFVTDVDHNFRVTPQGLPRSCDVTVDKNHTLTIAGTLAPGPNNSTVVKGLHCSVS